MAHNAPGKHFRKGLTLAQLFTMFPDDKTAEDWFVARRWPEGVRCPHCDHDDVQDGAAHRNQRFRCRGCRKRFSARTGTVLADSKLGFQTWLVAIYLLTTGLKGVSSMKLHRDLGVTQSTAWHLAHRIRKAWAAGENDLEPFLGPVEVDETYVGGKARNMHAIVRHQRIHGRGGVDKTPVVGVKDRATGKVSAQPVADTASATLTGMVADTTQPGSTVFTDGDRGYDPLKDMGYLHAKVLHSVGEYVRGPVSTNGIESLWSMLKRGYIGTYHHMSDEHLHRYVDEFTGRHNIRPLDTLEQMGSVVEGSVGKRLRYADLVAA